MAHADVLYDFVLMVAELLGTSFGHSPADGFAYIQDTFANPVFVVLYIIWLVALWFHLTHGSVLSG